MLHSEQQHCFEMGWHEGAADVRRKIRAIPIAPLPDATRVVKMLLGFPDWSERKVAADLIERLAAENAALREKLEK